MKKLEYLSVAAAALLCAASLTPAAFAADDSQPADSDPAGVTVAPADDTAADPSAAPDATEAAPSEDAAPAEAAPPTDDAATDEKSGQ